MDTSTYTSSYKKVDPKQTPSDWVASPVPDVGAVKNANISSMVTGTPVYVVVKDDGSAEITATEP